jgi:5'-nucleotidase / UDP-sugar diphosphatase
MSRILPVIASVLLSWLITWNGSAEPREIRILHINDFHGFAEPHQPLSSKELVGGVAYLAERADELRRERPSLLLAAGDMIQGNNWANLFQGESVIHLMNLMGFDAMVVGNHEFDFGQDVLRQRIAQARFPVLGANVDGFAQLLPYTIREVGGVRVGIVGVVTQDTPLSTHPKNVVGLKFRAPDEALRHWASRLKDKVDVLIALSHCGFHADREMAERLPGVQVIVGGHSHTRVDRPAEVANTVIVQAWEHGKVLGVLDLTLDEGRLIRWDGRLEDVRPDPSRVNRPVQELVDRYGERLASVLDRKVGRTDVDLDGENVRRRETNLGDLIADVMRVRSGADAAIINGGSIRTSIRQGEILAKQVYSALPFDNYIVAIRLSGTRIREALEHGVSGSEHGAGRFPQVSGLTFSFRASAPTGSRVQEILIGGSPIEPDREYVVATNDFLAAGGDGYRPFGDAVSNSTDFAIIGGMMKGDHLRYSDAGSWLRDVVIDEIRESGTISLRVEGRIMELP